MRGLGAFLVISMGFFSGELREFMFAIGARCHDIFELIYFGMGIIRMFFGISAVLYFLAILFGLIFVLCFAFAFGDDFWYGNFFPTEGVWFFIEF